MLLRLTCLLFLFGCSSAPTRPPAIVGSVEVAPATPDLSGVIAMVGLMTLAHGCPIAPDEALTNVHVAGIDFDKDAKPYMWEARGVIGLLGGRDLTKRNKFRDLAHVRPYKSEFPMFYPIASKAPEVGEKVWFLGYDWRKRRDAFSPRTFSAEVIRVRAGHLVFYRPGVAGSSGSCVVNAQGEAVAVNQGGHPIDDGLSEGVGFAVGIWPPLLELGS